MARLAFLMRLSLVRLMRTVFYPTLLILTVAATVASARLGDAETLPPVGVCDADLTEASAAVTRELINDGFVLCENEASLRALVGDGSLDCGFVIKSGFGASLSALAPDGKVAFIASGASFSPQLSRNRVLAAVFSVYAPYVSAEALANTAVPRDEVLAEYRARMEAGALFSFETETVAAAPVNRAHQYVLFTAALLLFTVVTSSFSALGDREQVGRIGASVAFRTLTVPAAVWRGLLPLMACVLIAAAVGWELLTPLFAYALLLAAFGAVSSALFGSKGSLTLSFFVLLLSLPALPLYFDVTAVVPLVGALRLCLPPYWLYVAVAHPLRAALAALAALPASLALLRLSLGGLACKK